MRILLYEFVTGGGWFSFGNDLPPESLSREGVAMAVALAADLAAIDSVELIAMRDQRQTWQPPASVTVHQVGSRVEELVLLRKLAGQVDAAIVIAPELHGFLAQRVSMLRQLGVRVLAPSMETIRLASDKHLTLAHLAERGIAVPHGVAIEPHDTLPEAFAYPAVLKLRGGAGSQGIRVVGSPRDEVNIEEPSRLEVYHSGQPASVLFLTGPAGNLPLLPCQQNLAADGTLAYLGGSLPLPPPDANRALRLAERAMAQLDSLLGFVGVDLILGPADDGSEDVVVEINPRLTTSYLGLRAATAANLAAAMLQTCEGRSADIAWLPGTVNFDTLGNVWTNPS
jgi:predicted ATP-grasp superfamily ATP-dependent carboligase